MGGSSTWVTLLGNITFYRSCGVGGPNFESQNFSKSRYENFDEIASKYIYIYSICTILYDQKWNVVGAETKLHLSLSTSRFWASYTVSRIKFMITNWLEYLAVGIVSMGRPLEAPANICPAKSSKSALKSPNFRSWNPLSRTKVIGDYQIWKMFSQFKFPAGNIVSTSSGAWIDMSRMINLYAIYARNGTINILLPFMDLLHNARPYVTRPASFSSHLHLWSWDMSTTLISFIY